MTVAARAVAANGPASGCIYTLDTSGIDVGMTGSRRFVHAGLRHRDQLILHKCVEHDRQVDPSRHFRSGSSAIIRHNGFRRPSPAPVTGVAPESNPLAYLTPPSFSVASCLPKAKFTGSCPTQSGPATAGGTVCYNGLSMTGSGSLTMNPGVYIINGAMSMTGSGSIAGSGVTIYLAPPSGSLVSHRLRRTQHLRAD